MSRPLALGGNRERAKGAAPRDSRPQRARSRGRRRTRGSREATCPVSSARQRRGRRSRSPIHRAMHAPLERPDKCAVRWARRFHFEVSLSFWNDVIPRSAVRHASGVLDLRPQSGDMAWAILLVAALFEIGWAVGLKYTNGFTRLWPTVGTVMALVLSVALLALAARSLPIGTAYAVWTGIGAAGTALFGVWVVSGASDDSAAPVHRSHRRRSGRVEVGHLRTEPLTRPVLFAVSHCHL